MSERELTFNGTKVIAHAWEHDANSRSFDYSNHVEQISILLDQQKAKNKPLLVIVVGQTGTGKTMLAKVLADNGSNAEYINCLEFSPMDRDRDCYSLLYRNTKTYLLDSPEFLNNSIWTSVDNHVKNGGISVCFVQRKDDYQGDSDCKYLMLNRTSFTWE